ncbi:hypothetical protein Vadar_008531 [Vaccinium darrowii]|uniref:Uncharacterized protein n=1 Tax=Vaccinium darrowii TaxID=229202 RepID=A0ACB7WYT9_9ERIC|nr:hypothetical protein Vadar_008531 [Vaccinium darrowii]
MEKKSKTSKTQFPSIFTYREESGKGRPPAAAPPASLFTSTSGIEHTITENAAKVNCLAFNPFNEWLVATGPTDETVKLFDLCKISTALHTFDRHKEEVFQVGWSPKNETILACCCLGWKLMLWVLSRIDEERTSEDAEDDPPELLFIHGSIPVKFQISHGTLVKIG